MTDSEPSAGDALPEQSPLSDYCTRVREAPPLRLRRVDVYLSAVERRCLDDSYFDANRRAAESVRHGRGGSIYIRFAQAASHSYS